ncbi:hypothetical protein [uncultured Rubinisphaera sp.]|uniref:hypothetical protein n=1 Tax=uncultured Rubinisphaera sp. TaxID=1678686 RepID=UPI0030D83E5E
MGEVAFLDNQGVVDAYTNIDERYRIGLDQAKPFSLQLTSNKAIASEVRAFLNNAHNSVFVLAGWIDQAVLEVKSIGDSFLTCALACDEYRPDQGGDMGIYLISDDKEEILEVGLSTELGRLWIAVHRNS